MVDRAADGARACRLDAGSLRAAATHRSACTRRSPPWEPTDVHRPLCLIDSQRPRLSRWPNARCCRSSSFARTVIDGVAAGRTARRRFSPIRRSRTALRLLAVLARADQGDLAVVSADVGERVCRAHARLPAGPLFEREIFEQWNVRPLGHPWLKPVRFPPNGLSADDRRLAA